MFRYRSVQLFIGIALAVGFTVGASSVWGQEGTSGVTHSTSMENATVVFEVPVTLTNLSPEVESFVVECWVTRTVTVEKQKKRWTYETDENGNRQRVQETYTEEVEKDQSVGRSTTTVPLSDTGFDGTVEVPSSVPISWAAGRSGIPYRCLMLLDNGENVDEPVQGNPDSNPNAPLWVLADEDSELVSQISGEFSMPEQ